jgi:uncharacterized protein (DUF849 family)
MNGQDARLIVNFAPTGMIPAREMTPHVPASAAEVVQDVHRVPEVGITMVHMSRVAEANEHRVKSPAELRTPLDLEPGNGAYGPCSLNTDHTGRVGQPG